MKKPMLVLIALFVLFSIGAGGVIYSQSLRISQLEVKATQFEKKQADFEASQKVIRLVDPNHFFEKKKIALAGLVYFDHPFEELDANSSLLKSEGAADPIYQFDPSDAFAGVKGVKDADWMLFDAFQGETIYIYSVRKSDGKDYLGYYTCATYATVCVASREKETSVLIE